MTTYPAPPAPQDGTPPIGTAIWVDPEMPPDVTTGGAPTWGVNAGFGGIARSWAAPVDGDGFTWNLTLTPGSWMVDLFALHGPSYGAAEVFADGVSLGVIDLYAAAAPATMDTQVNTVGPIVVVATHAVQLQLVMRPGAKNVASTGTTVQMRGFRLRRTA